MFSCVAIRPGLKRNVIITCFVNKKINFAFIRRYFDRRNWYYGSCLCETVNQVRLDYSARLCQHLVPDGHKDLHNQGDTGQKSFLQANVRRSYE